MSGYAPNRISANTDVCGRANPTYGLFKGIK
jgi:hypothetical protein